MIPTASKIICSGLTGNCKKQSPPNSALNRYRQGLKKKTNYMKKIIILFVFVFSFCVLNNCTNKPKEINVENYVISQHVPISNSLEDQPPPPPPPPPWYNWYNNLVIIFDSSNMVYVYQTELKYNDIESSVKSQDIVYPEYPYFIDLKPEHLIAFDNISFMKFILDNNDIFKFDTLFAGNRRFFAAVSTSDTITNPAFYELDKLIKTKRYSNRGVFYTVRMTTEEENKVIYCKDHKIKYKPKNYKWKEKYLNGKCLPLTEEYEKTQNKCSIYRKARETFGIECTEMISIE